MYKLLAPFGYFVQSVEKIEKKDLKLEESQNSDSSLSKWLRKWVRWTAFSVDMILPIIKLREKHYNYDLQKDWQRYYFYFHQLFGWFMATFILAGIAGVTQR